ncbi:MAG: hypothetical protein AVDCRST_MAG17-516, partial [uncultured Solirubrobacterales bacterium]
DGENNQHSVVRRSAPGTGRAERFPARSPDPRGRELGGPATYPGRRPRGRGLPPLTAPLLRASLRRSRGRRRALGVESRPARAAQPARALLRGGPARGRGRVGQLVARGGRRRAARRTRGVRGRPLDRGPRCPLGHARAGARARRAAFRLPAQGGRSALMAHPPPARRAEGRAGRGPERRVRRRRPCAPASDPLRPDHGGARPRRTAWRVPGPHPRRSAGHFEPGLAARAAPALARGERRPPGHVRDDLARRQPPLRQRPAAARPGPRRHRLLRRARRGRRPPRRHRRERRCRRARPRRAGARPADPLRGPGTPRRRGSLHRARARRVGRRSNGAARGARPTRRRL